MNAKKGLPPLLVSTRCIWNAAPHSAFTDLFIYNNKYYIAFREADTHQDSKNGIIRILESRDGILWDSKTVVEVEGLDLRDPKLTLMPDGRVHLLMGGSKLDAKGKLQSTSTRVAFGDSDFNFGPVIRVLEKNDWLWRITWHKGVGYGIAYHREKGVPLDNSYAALYQTEDGENFTKIIVFEIEGWPSEATIRFTEDDRMLVVLRRDKTWNTHALIGDAVAPFTDWRWFDLGYSLGGPNFISMPDGDLWITGRLLYGSPYGVYAKTALLKKEDDGFKRELLLHSFGDTSYPGMAINHGFLWISYYSSHEGKTSIYLAKVLLPSKVS